MYAIFVKVLNLKHLLRTLRTIVKRYILKLGYQCNYRDALNAFLKQPTIILYNLETYKNYFVSAFTFSYSIVVISSSAKIIFYPTDLLYR